MQCCSLWLVYSIKTSVPGIRLLPMCYWAQKSQRNQNTTDYRHGSWFGIRARSCCWSYHILCRHSEINLELARKLFLSLAVLHRDWSFYAEHWVRKDVNGPSTRPCSIALSGKMCPYVHQWQGCLWDNLILFKLYLRSTPQESIHDWFYKHG